MINGRTVSKHSLTNTCSLHSTGSQGQGGMGWRGDGKNFDRSGHNVDRSGLSLCVFISFNALSSFLNVFDILFKDF